MNVSELLRWQERAVCKGEDDFPFFDSDYAEEALNMCAVCPVKNECFEQFKNEEFGVFGGTTPEERREMGYGMGVALPWRISEVEGVGLPEETDTATEDELTDEFVRLYTVDRISMQSIAALKRVSRKRVKAALDARHVQARGFGERNIKPPSPATLAVVKLLEGGTMTSREIAAERGVSLHSVLDIRKRWNRGSFA